MPVRNSFCDQRKNRPNLVVLDLRLPQIDGYAVCKALKNHSDTAELPVIILTARGEPSERVHGLEIGADDYMTKPFSPRELVVRVQALLRRSRSSAHNDVVEVDNFQVYRHHFAIRVGGRRLDLTTTEFKLLAVLIERRGRSQSRNMLLNDVRGYRTPMETRTVDTHIRRLREKLGVPARRLETVRGEGYRLNMPASPKLSEEIYRSARARDKRNFFASVRGWR